MVVQPEREIAVITADPADNRVLEAVLAGEADYVVTGDRHLRAVAEYEGVREVSAAGFASMVG